MTPGEHNGRFMVAVGAVIEHTPTGNVLLLQRAPTSDFEAGLWEDITGRVHQFEEPQAALHREIREECGLTVQIVKPLTVFHLFRGDPTPDHELIGIVFWCTTSSDRVTLSHEHTDCRWLPPLDAISFVQHPGIKGDYEAFARERGLLA